MIGEIGGQLEAEAGKWIKENGTKPVVAFIAGETVLAGRTTTQAPLLVVLKIRLLLRKRFFATVGLLW